jgi:hypothetical protein
MIELISHREIYSQTHCGKDNEDRCDLSDVVNTSRSWEICSKESNYNRTERE